MNPILLRNILFIVSTAVISFLIARLAPEHWLKRIYAGVTWLIKVSFLFFVHFLIFLKPWKQHKERIGVYVWLFFLVIVGRYLVVEQPLITELQPQFIPFIGYIYFVTVLYLVKFGFEAAVSKENLRNS